MRKVVIALGGNALMKPGGKLTQREQYRNVRLAVRHISNIFKTNAGILITHGNGPQVGYEYLRNEHAKGSVPPLLFQELVAETQATIGTMLESVILEELSRMKVHRNVSTILTHVLVDKKDPAFKRPTKQIGPLYSKKELEAELKFDRFRYVKEGNGYRKVVASPRPIEVVEKDVIRRLVDHGDIVIAGGGGGIPIVKSETYQNITAVLDKDSTTQVIANSIGAQTLVILTSEDYVYEDYAKRRYPIKKVRAGYLEKMQDYFEEGTMLPKVKACVDFVKKGGERAFIGKLDQFDLVVARRAGTMVIR